MNIFDLPSKRFSLVFVELNLVMEFGGYVIFGEMVRCNEVMVSLWIIFTFIFILSGQNRGGPHATPFTSIT